MIIIIGESGSGKTELVKKYLSKNTNARKVVTYTTRPKRENEVDGVDYHFITEAAFNEFAKRGFFVEYNMYRGWYYGTALSDCSDSNNVVAVLTPAGFRALKRAGINVISVYLRVDRRSRLINILRRGDDIEEAYRRSLSDVGQFDGIIDEADYIIDNPNYKMSIDGVVRCLEAVRKTVEEKVNENGN